MDLYSQLPLFRRSCPGTFFLIFLCVYLSLGDKFTELQHRYRGHCLLNVLWAASSSCVQKLVKVRYSSRNGALISLVHFIDGMRTLMIGEGTQPSPHTIFQELGNFPLATGFLLLHDKLCRRFDNTKSIIRIGPARSLCQCNRCGSSHNVNKGYVLLQRKRGQNTI